MILTKESILAADCFKCEIVPAPRWGGDVIIREMSAFDRETLREDMGDTEKIFTKNLAGKVLVRCLAGEDHQRIFTDKEAEILAGRDQETLQILFDKALSLNKMNVKSEEVEKKSEPNLSEDLPSASA